MANGAILYSNFKERGYEIVGELERSNSST